MMQIYCVECRNRISRKRRRALPETTLCIQCAIVLVRIKTIDDIGEALAESESVDAFSHDTAGMQTGYTGYK